METKKLLTSAASVAASAMLIHSIVKDYLPTELHNYIQSTMSTFISSFSSQVTIVVEEKEGVGNNDLFSAAMSYLSMKIPPTMRRIKASNQDGEKNVKLVADEGEEVVDTFHGVDFRWVMSTKETREGGYVDGQYVTAVRTQWVELSFHKKHKDRTLTPYLTYVMDQWRSMQEEKKIPKLCMNQNGSWVSTKLRHPATFETLAMAKEAKNEVMEDLRRFVGRKEYYKSIGKAWKRGYLLHGPPGTGKSSLIAAMANFLRFDVYDLEMTEVWNNAALKELLLETVNRSIIVVEDIDCSMEKLTREDKEGGEGGGYTGQRDRLTLSGLLNFVDGLWSGCGDERIFIFTTNYKDRLDPALLRPGRMDMHVHMGYCCADAFRVLAYNYLLVRDHHLFGRIEDLLGEVEMTPAEVAEELLKSVEADEALRQLVDTLQRRKEDKEKKRDVEKAEVAVVQDLHVVELETTPPEEKQGEEK